MQGCVPSENRNRLSSSHWCNGRATFVHAEQEASALHVLAPYTAAHWSAVAARSRPCHVIRAQARLEQGSRLVPELVRGRLLATLWACAQGACTRVPPVDASRWLVSGPLMAAAERLGRWACSDEPGCLGQRHSILASEDGLPSRLVDVTPTANRRQLPLAPSLRAILPR